MDEVGDGKELVDGETDEDAIGSILGEIVVEGVGVQEGCEYDP